jgi:hypothetical protein
MIASAQPSSDHSIIGINVVSMALLLRPLLRRSAGFCKKSANSGVSLYSTAIPQSRRGLFALATGISGVAFGFGAAHFLHEDKAVVTPQLPQYGTAKEFGSAIEKLRTAFSAREGVVSTDPDDLKVHGLSTNTYHTGKADSSVLSITNTFPLRCGPQRCRVSGIYGGCGQNREDCERIQDAYHRSSSSLSEKGVCLTALQPYSGATSLEGQFIGVRN